MFDMFKRSNAEKVVMTDIASAVKKQENTVNDGFGAILDTEGDMEEPIVDVEINPNAANASVVDRALVAKLIEELHKEANTMVDTILKESKIAIEETDSEVTKIKHYDALQKLGFSSSKPATSQEAREAKEKRIKNQTILEAVEYFSQKYPLYKFITFESVNKLCEKYGLVFANANKYIGDIPEKNIEDLINFKVEDMDKSYMYGREYFLSSGDYNPEPNVHPYSEEYKFPMSNSAHSYEFIKANSDKFIIDGFEREEFVEEKFILIAPKSDFMEMKKNYSSNPNSLTYSLPPVPDPIAIKPVIFKNMRFGLIATAWGLEASDELVVNEKMN